MVLHGRICTSSRFRRRGAHAAKPRVRSCKEEQRRHAACQTCHRVSSGLTHWVTVVEAVQPKLCKVFKVMESGRLRFLGSCCNGFFDQPPGLHAHQTLTAARERFVMGNQQQGGTHLAVE